MVIIGITGPIGHGKTTLGQAFQALQTYATHYESSDVITDLAQAWLQAAPELPKSDDIPAINHWLKALVPILNQTFDVNASLDDIKLTKELVENHPSDYDKLFAFLEQPHVDLSSPEYEAKENYRTLLQWMGGYFVKKIDDGIWYNYIVKQINKDKEDGVSLCTVGGLRYPRDAEIFKTTGGVIVGIERPGVKQADLDDMTERQRRDIPVDTVLLNNGDVNDLQNTARLIYEDIIANKLQKQYSAVPNRQ